MKNSFIIFSILIVQLSISQNEMKVPDKVLPYYEVPQYPEKFTAGTMAARMIDALGFRFYWASFELRDEDLEYRLNPDSRSTVETIDHILGLSYIITNSTLKKPNGKNDISKMGYKEKRSQVLLNLKQAADILRESEDISQYKILFGDNEIPFWNQVNGPIADAIWHCGQLASLRRMSGNPINPNIDHFRGTIKE